LCEKKLFLFIAIYKLFICITMTSFIFIIVQMYFYFNSRLLHLDVIYKSCLFIVRMYFILLLVMYFQQNRTTESFKITLNKQADLIYHFKVGLGQKKCILECMYAKLIECRIKGRQSLCNHLFRYFQMRF
jgi:signal transduction histidine kinase